MAREACIDVVWARLTEWEADTPASAIHALIDKRCARAPDDPIALPALLKTLDTEAVGIPRPDLKHKPALCPDLVRIDPENQPLRRHEDVIRLLAQNLVAPVSVHGRYVAAFVKSGTPAPTLAHALARRLVQHDIHGRPRVTALFEPLRLALYLGDTPDSKRRDAWLADAEAWLTVNGAGELLQWQRSAQVDALAGRLPYTPDDALRQARIPEIRRLLVAMRKAGIAPTAQVEHTLADHLADADRHRLHDPEDRTLYVLNSLSFGPGWDALAAVQACIAQAARNEQRLASALESLSELQKSSMAQSGEADPMNRNGAFA